MSRYGNALISLFVIVIGLLIIASLFRKIFPNNKISNSIEKIADWISDNIRF